MILILSLTYRTSRMEETRDIARQVQASLKRLATAASSMGTAQERKERKTVVDKLTKDFGQFNDRVSSQLSILRQQFESTPIRPQATLGGGFFRPGQQQQQTGGYGSSSFLEQDEEQERISLIRAAQQQEYYQVEEEAQHNRAIIAEREDAIRRTTSSRKFFLRRVPDFSGFRSERRYARGSRSVPRFSELSRRAGRNDRCVFVASFWDSSRPPILRFLTSTI